MPPISNSYHLKLGFSGDAHTGGPHPMGHAVYVGGGNTNTDTDNSQYASDTFVVPNGVTQISAVCVGGGGGASSSYNDRNLDGDDFPSDYGAAHPDIPRDNFGVSPPILEYEPAGGSGGGGGGLAYGTFAVTPGETLTIRVGYGGTGGDLFKAQGLRAYPGCGQHGGSSKIMRGSTILLEGGGGRAGLQYPYSDTSPTWRAVGDGEGGAGGITGGTEREGGQTGGRGGDGDDGDEGGGGGGAGGYSYGSDPAVHVGLGSGGSANTGQNGDGFGSTFGGGSGGGYDRHNIYGTGNLLEAHNNGGGGVGVYYAYRNAAGNYQATREGGDRGTEGLAGSAFQPTNTTQPISLGEYGGSSGFIDLGGKNGRANSVFVGWSTTRGGEGGKYGGGGGGATHYAHINTITIGQTGGHGANGIVRIIFGGKPTSGVETGRSFPEFNTTFGSE